MTTGSVLPESALTIARARIGESIAAHARSIGILDLPADRLGQMIEHAIKLLEGLSPSELSNLSPSSGQLMTAVATSFNLVYGQLSEGQLRAMKNGIDPANLGAVQAFLAGGLHGAMFAAGGASGATPLVQGRANYRAALDGVEGVSAQKMASYSAQYGGLGFDQTTIGLFAAIDLSRANYNAFTREGYSGADIKDAASDTKALGWKGSDAFGDAIHAPDQIRKAGVALVGATTDEERATREQELERIYEGLSPTDKEKAAPFLRRLNATHKLDAEASPEIARAIADAALTAQVDTQALASAKDQSIAADAARSQKIADAGFLASLDMDDKSGGKAVPSAAIVRKPAATPGPP